MNSESSNIYFTCDANGPYYGHVGEPIQFEGSASGGEPPYFFYWEFGDGEFVEEQNPTHIYDVEGTYPVFLHCYDYYEQYAYDQTWAYIIEEEEDEVPPTVTITFPLDGGYYYENPNITVFGTAQDNVGVTVLGGQHWWNGGYTESGDNNLPEPFTIINFDWQITLRLGENRIRIYAKDAANNYNYDEVIVNFVDDYITTEELVKELDKVMEMLGTYNNELNAIQDKVTDSDRDGYPDDVDVDSDGDGTPNHQDKDPKDPKKSRDTDGDGEDDSTDADDDNDGIPDATDDDDDGDGNSDEDEKIFNDNLQKLKAMRDPAVNAAIAAAEAISPGDDLFSDRPCGGDYGQTTYSGTKPNIQGRIDIDLSKHRNPDGSIDEDEKLDTMLHEMRHCYQTWLIQQNEVTLGVDLDGDGELEDDVTNDEDDDWLPGNVPAGMDDEGDLQDDDDKTPKPWDPDVRDKRDKDAEDFAAKKLKKFKDAKWNWQLEWLKDLISELNTLISLLNSIISELDNISNKLAFLGMTDEQEVVDDLKGDLEGDRGRFQGAVGTLSGYLPPGSNADYPDWWPYRTQLIQNIQTALSNSGDLLDLAEDIISNNGYLPDLDIIVIGTFSWTELLPGETVTTSFKVKNIGDNYSQLDWEISEQPTWGTWIFEPEEGENLGNKEGPRTIQVTITAPDEKNEDFSGQIKIVNKDDVNDYETIPITLTTSKNKNIYRFPLIQKYLEKHPNLLPILRLLLI
jgi:hypothetical protein